MRNSAEAPEKKVKEDAVKTKEAVIQTEKAAEEAKNVLSADDLDKVSGGEDPFEEFPRIEPEPIDDELRKKG